MHPPSFHHPRATARMYRSPNHSRTMMRVMVVAGAMLLSAGTARANGLGSIFSIFNRGSSSSQKEKSAASEAQKDSPAPSTQPQKKNPTTANASPPSGNKKADPEPVDVTPFGGAPTIKPGKPDWCNAAPFPASDGWFTKDYYSQLIHMKDVKDVLRAAQHPCRAVDDERRQQWSAAWRQVIANRTGADEQLISRFLALLLKLEDKNGSKLKSDTCAAFSVKPAPGQREPSQEEKDLRLATAYGVGCERNVHPVLESGIQSAGDYFHWYDRRVEPPSQLILAVMIIDKLGLLVTEAERNGQEWRAQVLNRLGRYAQMANDIPRLDESKLKTELDAMKLNDYGRVMAEMTFAKARHLGRIFESVYKEMSPEIQELAFKAPKEGFAEWEKLYAANKEGVDLGWEVELKFMSNQTKDLAPCHMKAHKAFTDYVTRAAKNKKTLEEKKAVMNDSMGFLLLRTSMICASLEKMYPLAATLFTDGLENKLVWRGPRNAAYWAMMERYAKYKNDDPSFPVSAMDVSGGLGTVRKGWEYRAYEMTFNKSYSRFERGVVKSVQKDKDGVKLTFATDSWKETLWDCVETNKIDRIVDGKIEYRRNCKAKGERTVKETVEPFVVPATYAAGISAGSFVEAQVENQDGNRKGFPTAVYAGKDKKKLTGALGAVF